ncbi:MAG: hypothetical protein ACQETL_01600 [Bacteroidota bacterium]
MNKLSVTIFSFFALFAISACNIEDDVQPATQNSYIKIIQGEGSDAPLSVQELNGDLLIVSNSTIVERGNPSNRVRVLKLNLNGDEVVPEQYYPRNSDQDWNVKDMIVIDDQRIILGGTVGADDSLFFLEINAQLDSVNSRFYSSEMENYQLTGLSYDETNSKVYFGGSEWTEGEGEFTIFGQINASDLSIEQPFRSSKAKALPATPILEDASGGLIWAYNTGNSELVRSPNRSMQQIEDIDDLNFKNGNNIVSKKLIMTEDGKVIILGELDDSESQRMMFFYEVYSGDDPIIFGGSGPNQLNGAKQTENGFLVAGSTQIDKGNGNQLDFYLSRRGQNGGESFSLSFGSDADEELHDAVMVNDDIYSIGSTVIGIENTLLLIKTDKFGRLVN